MRERTWKIIDYGPVARDARTIEYDCPYCGHEAMMPVLGRPLAQVPSGGVVFDNDGPFALPPTVQCRKCRRILTTDPDPEDG